MYIVAIAWIYVVSLMSIAEQTVVAGIMTFLLYGVLPLAIILYLSGSAQRKRRHAAALGQPSRNSNSAPTENISGQKNPPTQPEN